MVHLDHGKIYCLPNDRGQSQFTFWSHEFSGNGWRFFFCARCHVSLEHSLAAELFATMNARMLFSRDLFSVDCTSPSQQQVFILEADQPPRRPLEIRAVVSVVCQFTWRATAVLVSDMVPNELAECLESNHLFPHVGGENVKIGRDDIGIKASCWGSSVLNRSPLSLFVCGRVLR